MIAGPTAMSLTAEVPRGAAGHRRRRVLDACHSSPWASAHRAGRVSFVALVEELAQRGLFDCRRWDGRRGSPDQYLDDAVVACLENRQAIEGDLFGVTFDLDFWLRYGSAVVGCRAAPHSRMQFYLAAASDWDGQDGAKVTLTFGKADGVARQAAGSFLSLADATAGMGERGAARMLAHLAGELGKEGDARPVRGRRGID